jgi:DNA-binding LacI/PurR family transcriptional regulator
MRINEIAARYNVSETTVRRVLSGVPRKELRVKGKRVFDFARGAVAAAFKAKKK